MVNKKNIFIISLIVFVDLLAFSITFPVIPYYVAEFSVGASMVGILSAIYALGQFLFTPIIGRLSDRFGRKPLILLCVAGSIAGYSFLGFAQNLWMLLIGKIIGGILGSTVSLAYTYTSDCTDESSRAYGMGYLGAAFGAAFTFGPAIGGILSKHGYTLPIKISALLALLNLVLVFIFLREPQRNTKSELSVQSVGNIFTSIIYAFRIPTLRSLLLQWFLFSLAFATFQSNIGLFNKYHLHLSPRESSVVFATIGILVTIVQGGLVKRLTQRYNESTLLLICSLLFTITLFLWANVWNMTILLILLVPLCFAASMIITLTNSIISKAGTGDNTGSIIGVAAGLDNLTRAVTALGGGLLIEHSGTAAPGIAAGIIMIIASWATYRRFWEAE